MKVWTAAGKFEDMEIGRRVLVAHSGSGHTYFGEYATLTRHTKQHLVFTTDSGAQVKTDAENLCRVVGKAAKENLFVSVNIENRDNDPNFIHQEVSFWDEKKLQFVKR